MTPRPTRKRIWRKRLTRATLCLLLGAVTTVGVAWGCQLCVDVRTSADRSGEMVVALGDQYWRLWWMGGSTWTLSQADVRVITEDEAAALAAEWEREFGADATRAERAAIESMRNHPPVKSLKGAAIMRAAPLCIDPPPAPAGAGGYSYRETMAWGWPWRSVGNTHWERKAAKSEEERAGEHGQMTFRGKQLSFCPLWPGLLLDTLFYAAPWWLILITPGAFRRFQRRRRGRCVHCGYGLAGLPGGMVPGGTVLRTVTDADGAQHEDTARRAVPPTCPECGQPAPPPS